MQKCFKILNASLGVDAQQASGECPWGTDVVDCGGVNYAVWVTGMRYLRTLRTMLAADDGQDE